MLDTFIPLFADLFQCHVGRLHDEDCEGGNANCTSGGKDVLATQRTGRWSVVSKDGKCCRGGRGELGKDVRATGEESTEMA